MSCHERAHNVELASNVFNIVDWTIKAGTIVEQLL